jgi:hypothetical protein
VTACGLWLINKGLRRPENLWNNDSTRRDSAENSERPKRPSRAKRQRADDELRSELTDYNSDAINSQIPRFVRQESTMSESFQIAESERNDEPDLSVVPESVEVETQPPQIASRKSTPGSRKSPIELDHESNTPVRRSLFSSPKSSGPLGKDVRPKSPLKEKSTLDLDIDLTIDEPEESVPQIQRPSTPQQQETITLPPVTPLRGNNQDMTKSPSDFFKTPSNPSEKSSAKRITTSDFFSSAAKAFLHGPTGRTPTKAPATPSKSTQDHLDDMTITPNLRRILREAWEFDNNGLGIGDFLGDVTNPRTYLGSKSPSPNGRGNAKMDISNREEVAVPTSSPPQLFEGYQDPLGDGVWEDIPFDSSPLKTVSIDTIMKDNEEEDDADDRWRQPISM